MTITDLKRAGILEEVLDFITEKTIDYFEFSNYIVCHGWIPLKATYEKNEMIYTLKDADVFEWKQARWQNGMEAWKHGFYIKDKTIICGHWHCSFGNSHYHLYEHLKEWPEKNRKNWQESFKPFIDEGIIALDACTAWSKLVNVIVIEQD